MALNKRRTAILKHLLHTDAYSPMEELIEKFKVSRRTIYYDVEKINDWLTSQGLDEIDYIRSAGFVLTDRAKKLIPNKIDVMKAWHYEYTPLERKAWIAIYLSLDERAFFLEDLMDKVQVSRNTLIEDMKTLREELESFGLKLEFNRDQGHVVLGNESEIRKAVLHYLNLAIHHPDLESLIHAIKIQKKISNGDNPLFNERTIKKIYELVYQSEKKLNLQFTDETLYSLALRLIIISKRVKHGNLIEMNPIEREILVDTTAFQVAKNLCRQLKDLCHTSFKEEEQLFITVNLLGAKVNYLEEEFQDQNLAHQLQQVAEAMVDNFQRYACILFHDRESVVKNLLLHLKPAYYRVKYDIEVDNRMVESIKYQYEEIYSLTKKAVRPFELILGKAVPDNEIAYISIHFGGWLRREGVTPISRKKALLVCANGVGTTQILKQQLEGLFSNIDIEKTVSVRDYEENEFDVDFVVSTTPIKKKEHPVFIVSPILTDTEKESLLKEVNLLLNDSKQHETSIEGLLDVIERHADIRDRQNLLQDLKKYLFRPAAHLAEEYKPDLLDLLNEETIQVKDRVEHWREAITIAAQPLISKKTITGTYIRKMIQNVETHGPYIVVAPKIAIPHAEPGDGASDIGMSLLKLNEPVSFSSDAKHDVYFIIVLAAIDNESHLKALSQLIRIFSNEDQIEQMLNIDTSKELIHFLKQIQKN